MEHYNKRANIYSPVFDKCNLNRDKILYNKEKFQFFCNKVAEVLKNSDKI